LIQSVIVLVAVYFLGIATCIRLTQLAVDDTSYERAANRLRHW
jgi:hypothetical protein